jgi:hypothetical protein
VVEPDYIQLQQVAKDEPQQPCSQQPPRTRGGSPD